MQIYTVHVQTVRNEHVSTLNRVQNMQKIGFIYLDPHIYVPHQELLLLSVLQYFNLNSYPCVRFYCLKEFLAPNLIRIVLI